jgi:hypothetical protein
VQLPLGTAGSPAADAYDRRMVSSTMTRGQSANRRAGTRHEVDIEARINLDGAQTSCSFRDLSRGGAFASIGPLPLGTIVMVWFELPDGGGSIEVDATVRWTAHDGVGLQFGGLRARDAWALGRYLDGLRRASWCAT